jgi:hypothetical protein
VTDFSEFLETYQYQIYCIYVAALVMKLAIFNCVSPHIASSYFFCPDNSLQFIIQQLQSVFFPWCEKCYPQYRNCVVFSVWNLQNSEGFEVFTVVVMWMCYGM